MRGSAVAVGAAAIGLLAGAVPAGAAGAGGDRDAQRAVLAAGYEMNEPSGATRMNDSSGHGLHGVVDQDGVDTGFRFGGATGYHWTRRAPNQAPASPERVVTVRDAAQLDPGTDVFTVALRYRTRENFGNIIQKGQSRSNGGQWKFQNPQGRPSCLFKGSAGRATARAPVALSDNRWHRLECVRAPDSVTMYVDGTRVSRRNAATGSIDNTSPLTVGGKRNCDQITVTCDYFSGDIDYVRIRRG
jgi:hypothetical protein